MRDRESAKGLLPRMEARPTKAGFSYRYHPIGGKPIPLGQDRELAIRKVLDLNGDNSDRGTVAELWRLYQVSPEWVRHAEATRTDYTQSSVHVLKLFGKMRAASVKPVHLNRYLRVERATAPIRANREMALLSNLLNMAVNRGDLDANPCKQVRRNTETPRSEAPSVDSLARFLAWVPAAKATLAGMAEFAALAGSRRMEFLRLQWPQVSEHEVRTVRGKQRNGKEVVERIAMSPAMADLLARLRARAEESRVGPVFPTARRNQPYTESGFKTMWGRLMDKAVKAGIVEARFTFHDLRAYYTTQHKIRRGALPDLHANPATTARVYDRTKESKRGAL